MARRDTSRNIAGQRELAPGVTHPRSTQMSFQNGSLIRLLFQIPKILKHTPLPATSGNTSVAPLTIMVMVHEDFTGKMATMSGKIIKERNHLFVSPMPIPTKYSIAPT